jgi:hypothetical protein
VDLLDAAVVCPFKNYTKPTFYIEKYLVENSITKHFSSV